MTPLQAANLDGLDGIRHGFFGRAGGVSGGIYDSLNCGLGSKDERAAVVENRDRVSAALGAKAGSVVTLYQIHSATAVVVDGPVAQDRLPKADAVVTSTRGVVVGALAADCAPVLFADAEARVVAAAHAGWRGAVGGILEATIEAMEGEGAARQRIRACVGPAIGQGAYEVGPEFEAGFLQQDRANARFFVRPDPEGRPYFDLAGYVAARLSAQGLASVGRQAPCTYDNESKFFSYRRSRRLNEPDYGRQISAIVLA